MIICTHVIRKVPPAALWPPAPAVWPAAAKQTTAVCGGTSFLEGSELGHREKSFYLSVQHEVKLRAPLCPAVSSRQEPFNQTLPVRC